MGTDVVKQKIHPANRNCFYSMLVSTYDVHAWANLFMSATVALKNRMLVA